MMGKGSINHNERKFAAENVNRDRIKDNVAFVSEDIKVVYAELFGEALERYNAKMRKDRVILDYYEHIRKSKQEKLFYEAIFQIGNKDDMPVGTEDGELAKQILCEYMEEFQERNPNLRVFSAHLHMDEATPHLHIDYIPFTTGSKRGLETRVSMKSALADQGYKGKGRSDTEYNRWIDAEKQQLAKVMQRHGIEWNRLGTHKEHLSVLDYKREERVKEVKELDNTIHGKLQKVVEMEDTIHDKSLEVMALEDKRDITDQQINRLEEEQKKAEKQTRQYKKKLQELALMVDDVQKYAIEYSENIERILPEAGSFESGKAYREKKAIPGLKKLVDIVRSLYAAFLNLKNEYDKLRRNYQNVTDKNERLNMRVYDLKEENESLVKTAIDYERVKKIYGPEKVELAVTLAEAQERATQNQMMKRKFNRGER